MASVDPIQSASCAVHGWHGRTDGCPYCAALAGDELGLLRQLARTFEAHLISPYVDEHRLIGLELLARWRQEHR